MNVHARARDMVGPIRAMRVRLETGRRRTIGTLCRPGADNDVAVTLYQLKNWLFRKSYPDEDVANVVSMDGVRVVTLA